MPVTKEPLLIEIGSTIVPGIITAIIPSEMVYSCRFIMVWIDPFLQMTSR